MDSLSDLLYTLLPLAFLSGVVLLGYYFAWTDFKPKHVPSNEEYLSPFEAMTSSEKPKHEFTKTELGIQDFDNVAALSDSDQKRLKMEDMVRQYSQEAPEEAANVIKGWLRDR